MNDKKRECVPYVEGTFSSEDNIERLVETIYNIGGEVYGCSCCNKLHPFVVEEYFEGCENEMEKHMNAWDKCNKCEEKICPDCIKSAFEDCKCESIHDNLLCQGCSNREYDHKGAEILTCVVCDITGQFNRKGWKRCKECGDPFCWTCEHKCK